MNKVAQRIAVFVLLAALVYLAYSLPVADLVTALEAWASENPKVGAVGYIAVTIVATTILTPGWILMMLAGLVFGLTLGLVYAMLGIVGGAVAAFFVGRTFARDWVVRQISGNAQLMALDDALEDKAFTIVFLTRIALVFPFNVLNYVYGVTRVRTPIYAAGTAAGMLPIVGAYVYLGTLARDVGQILEEGADIGSGAWVAIAVATVAIVTVVLVVRRALNQALAKQSENDA